MTNPTPHGQVPEALQLADEISKAGAFPAYPRAPYEAAAAELRRLHAYCQELEAQVFLDCMTHAQNPAENEHVAGDVSKNGAELNMSAQQPAPATQQAGDVVAYLDVGAGGYLDLGSELSEDALQQLPKGRHALVIAGTYGIDGYVAAPQPSPTTKPAPQQEAQGPATVPYQKLAAEIDLILSDPDTELSIGAKRALLWMRTWVSVPLFTAPQPAPAPLSDDVVRDAARYRLLRRGQHWSVIDGISDDLLRAEALDAAVDAARAAQKEGEKP